MKIIRKPKPIRIVPFVESRGQNRYLVIRDESEVFKWNFSEILLDERPKYILVGDSVTSGYFYRPNFTLGILLQEAIPDYQVIDLTRTELSFYSLPDYAPLLKALKPEKLILAVGYNFDTEPNEELYERVLENYEWALEVLPPTSVQIIVPQLTSLLKTIPRHAWLRPAIQKAATQLQIPYLDLNEIFKDDSYLIDYTHYTYEGLKIISQALTGIKSTFELSDRFQIESLLNAFFACYYRSYTELCIRLLVKLKPFLKDDFSTLCEGIRKAIFSDKGGLFEESSLKYFYERKVTDFVVPVTNTNHLYFPEKTLLRYLDSNIPEPHSFKAKTKINLLELRRRTLSKYKASINPALMRSPGAIPINGEVGVRFHSGELLTQNVKLIYSFKSEGPLKLKLNGVALEFSHEGTGELALNLTNNNYYELVVYGTEDFRIDRLLLSC